MNIKKREAWLFYAIVGLLASWFVLKVIFGPFHEKLSALGRELIVEEARVKKSSSLIENQEAISREYAKFETYFSLQEFSDEGAVASFLREVEKISTETGLAILDMKPQKEAKSDKFSKQYQINIKAEANLKQLVNFLYSLYDAPVLFSVEKLVLVPKSDSSSVLSVTLTVVGVSFL